MLGFLGHNKNPKLIVPKLINCNPNIPVLHINIAVCKEFKDQSLTINSALQKLFYLLYHVV